MDPKDEQIQEPGHVPQEHAVHPEPEQPEQLPQEHAVPSGHPLTQMSETSEDNTYTATPVPLTDAENMDPDSRDVNDLQRVLSNPESLHKLQSYTEQISRRMTAEEREELKTNEDTFDLARILDGFVQKSHEQGVHMRSAGVGWKDLTTDGIDQSTVFVPSVSELLRTLATLPVQIGKAFNKKQTRHIIQNNNGVLKAGEMCLVLGRPGSGCSTFLKTITGQVGGYTGVEGTISYDGLNQKDMLEYFKSDIIYNGELDVHFPHLTVEETLNFAVGCRTPRQRLDGVSRQEYVKNYVQLLATVFGLKHAYNTKVGNDFVRGVSGGERKRVSIAEALATRASIFAWDNATRGLDASTALEYSQAIRATTNILNNASFVAIYQAGEHIYNLFDKVTVLYSGRQIYYGPADHAKDYFQRMGYECPARQTTAEFLTAVTDPLGRQPFAEMVGKVPTTAEQFEQYWLASPEYQMVQAEYEDYVRSHNADETFQVMQDSLSKDKMKRQRKKSPYIISFAMQMRLLLKRGGERLKGDMAYQTINVCANIIQALVIGSLFYNITESTAGAFSRGGVLFFTLLFNALASMAEISHSFSQRPIIVKQKSYSFYHPAGEALQALITDVPGKLVTMICFTLIVYFLTNLNRTAGQYFAHLFILFVTTQCMTAFFQVLASATPSVEVANSLAGIGILIIVVYSGYMIPTPTMHVWFKWLNRANPVAYGFEALMANEFHHRVMTCEQVVPAGPDYSGFPDSNKVCSFSGSTPGSLVVTGDNYIKNSFNYSFSHMWRNLGILFAFWMGFVFFNVTFSEYIQYHSSSGDVLLFKRGHIPEELQQEGANVDEVIADKAQADDMEQKMDRLLSLDEERDVFTWQNVDYVIPLAGGQRKLLDNVQGYVKPGTITALMGESGAGKTTLLNVLSQRINFGVITGDMFVNGRPLDRTFQRRTGYVQQQDLHLAESTVRESLIFSARLRQPSFTPDQEKIAYCDKIIKLLGMEAYSESLVGESGRGLNVEQRKKLSIGVELVAKPSLLLFLDEPTSGLDSQSAWAIVQFLKNLAAAGQAILCTIHQPSATLFEEFDRLLLLKKGGQTVYFGDIGKNSNTLVSYFERQGGRKCAPDENPAEYILECIGAGATATAEGDWHDKWKNSDEFRQTTDEIAKLQSELAQRPQKELDPSLQRKYAAPYLTQMRWVLRRTQIQFWRSPGYIMAKFMLLIVGGLFIGFSFWDIKFTLSGMQNAIFAVFMITTLCVPLINQIQSFAFQSRELFEVRESSSNTFHWSCLIFSQFISELPYALVGGTIFYCCVYFPTKLGTSARVAGYFYFIYAILFNLYYLSFGLWILYFSPDVPSASIITSLMFSFVIAFCGVMQPSNLMPGFWTFMYKLSPFTYIIQSYVGDVMHDRKITCLPREFSRFNPPSGQTCQEYAGKFLDMATGYLENPSATTECGYCPYTVADEFIAGVGIKYSYRWRNVGFICAYIIFNICAMVLCYYLARVRVWRTGAAIANWKAKRAKSKAASKEKA
ncbi:Protein SNQ2 [Yarrowia sp. C11]|nr:Protein SNQ2 [Yarrowia sp. C11]